MQPEEGRGSPTHAEAPADRAQPRGSGEEPQGLSLLLGDEIDRAARGHHALALVGAQLAHGAADPGLGAYELRQKTEAFLHDALGPAAQGKLFLDGEAGIVWLILPGVLPKRAVQVAREIGAIMEQSGLTPSALAVAGYPRDGSTAEELAVRCREAIESIVRESAGPQEG